MTRNQGKPKRMVRGALLVLAIFTGIAVLTVAVSPLGGILMHVAYVDRTARKLQHRTDHAQLLSECRHLLSQRDDYVGHNAWPESPYIHLSADQEHMPSLIRSLAPAKVVVEEDAVLLIFSGGHIHLAVRGYAEGHEGYGLELTPGLYMIGD